VKTTSVFLAVLDEFLLTSVQVWEKKSDKIVDTVTLIQMVYVRSSREIPHFLWIQRKNMATMNKSYIRVAEMKNS
jgi:hypothetical protein